MGMVFVTVLVHQYHRCVHTLGHVFIGQGQPSGLRILLGCIETMSTSFRAVSLSLRVVCNATAGHVLLAVLVEMTVCSDHAPRHLVGDSWWGD